MSAEWIALIGILGTLAGVLITSVFNFLSTRQAKDLEERKHRQELIIKAAIESYKLYCENVRASGQPVTLLPLEDFILIMIKSSEIIADEKIDFSNLEKKLAEITELKDRLYEHHESWRQNRKLQRRS